jgi:MFS family permease
MITGDTWRRIVKGSVWTNGLLIIALIVRTHSRIAAVHRQIQLEEQGLLISHRYFRPLETASLLLALACVAVCLMGRSKKPLPDAATANLADRRGGRSDAVFLALCVLSGLSMIALHLANEAERRMDLTMAMQGYVRVSRLLDSDPVGLAGGIFGAGSLLLAALATWNLHRSQQSCRNRPAGGTGCPRRRGRPRRSWLSRG